MTQKNIISIAPHDVVAVIRRVNHEIKSGLDIGDALAVSALAIEIERGLAPRIIPDRLYSVPELKKWFGYTHSAIYGRHRHLIRKDNGKSVAIGREILADQEAMPHLVPADPGGPSVTLADDPTMSPSAARRRGRPRKNG